MDGAGTSIGRGARTRIRSQEEAMSLWTILFVILLLAWIMGWGVFHVAGAMIHLLLLFAVISLVLHFVAGARTA